MMLLIIALSVMAIVGFFGLAIGMQWLAATRMTLPVKRTERQVIAPSSPRSWRLEPPALLQSGSATPDVAGITRIDGHPVVVLLEGATGRVLWRAPGAEGMQLYADGAGLLLSADMTKRVARYDAKTGVVKWSITVADHVHEITFGPGCAAVLFGSKPTGIDTKTGNVTQCTPRRAPVVARLKDQPHDVEFDAGELQISGALELDDKPVNAAPPRFAVSASRAGKRLWRVAPDAIEPIWTSDGFDRSIALSPAGVFVFGRSSADHTARWLLLDLASGRTLYERSSTVKVESRVLVSAAGPLVYVVHDNRLDAFRAASGEVAWSVE
jgi:outer membrane protein assembly factor BamB